MKKVLLSITLALSILNIGIAQEFGKNNEMSPHFGFKIGANYSSVYHKQGVAFNETGKFGWAFGSFTDIPLSKKISVQPELMFSGKGFKATGMLLGNPYELTRTTSYIEAPVFIAVKASPLITFLGGLQLTAFLNKTDRFEQTKFSAQQKALLETDKIETFAFGLAGGVDVNVKDFVISARTGWALTGNNVDVTTNTLNYRNMYYQLTFGFRGN